MYILKMNNSPFKRLSDIISENTEYEINDEGIKLLNSYHKLIKDIERSLNPLLKPFTKDSEKSAMQSAIHIVSLINSQHEGNELMNLAVHLEVLTNGGKSKTSISFNPEDKILQYLRKV